MRDIILDANLEGIVAFNLSDLEIHLRQVKDKRSRFGKIYPLSMILVIYILARLSGEDKPSAVTSWYQNRKELLLSCFDFHHRRLPCLNTIRNVLGNAFDVEELGIVLTDYLHRTYGGQESCLLTMDGKTMRGTIPKGLTRGVHLLAVYLPDEGITLKQVKVAAKTNEIGAAKKVLTGVSLKNRVLCADAMQTQRELSVYVLSKGGNYTWMVKDNQPTLRADVERFFQPVQHAAGWHIQPLPRTIAETKDKGHGRLEVRRLTLIVDDQQFLDWPGVCQVFMIERIITNLRTNKQTTEVVYGITSCTPQQCNAQQLLTWIRDYWGIENGLHYRRDVTLNEDATRLSSPTMATAIATINNFVIGLALKLGFTNLAAARRTFDAVIASQLLCKI